ncbi:CDP-alcohol phosphatidyltransferase-domain-containing protein [Sphaerosporella brunnea]|uniref:diacylglycerol cholinephosphotransferase n=1 Tax=Sphaerosporella brunnea TaxID=1250544 RepID=A0A5J5FBN6_9PEZI|nr:CDP-alcohol phosphatidyltransferase-domain-containing protein [Sphaerosporella brunnea]
MYIRQSKLRHLKEYQYSGVDHSLVSRYILKPFYTNVFIHVFPMSMAPNLITLTGFFFVVVNFLTMLWYNPTLDRDCPAWVYASFGLGLFLYQTFDACDGTQARRTGQSGPLGELFDHGVDAINTTLGVVIFAGTVNLGQSWATLLTAFASLCAFYLTTWEEYHTGTLYLGLVSGPVEGVLTLCAVYFITAIKGGSFWQRPMLETLGVPSSILEKVPELLRGISFVHWWLVYGGLMLGFNIVQSSLNVIRARRAKGLPAAPALAGLLPFFLTWLAIPAWLSLRPLILTQHLVPFLFFVGIAFAYQVGLIIVSHLTKSSFPFLNVLYLPILVGLLDAAGPWIRDFTAFYVGKAFGWRSALGDGEFETAYVFACLGLALGVHGSFVVDVITNICDYLDIWCLTIKHPKVLAGEKKKN